MCGIVGIVGNEAVAPRLVKSLKCLEYRGYDSCGIATYTSQGIEIRKDVGGVTAVAERHDLASIHGHIGIAHTRWDTTEGSREKMPTHT